MNQFFRTLSITVLLMGGSTIIFCLLDSCCKTCGPKCKQIISIHLETIDNADSLPHAPVNNEVYAKALLLHASIQDTSGNNICKNRLKNPLIPAATAMMCDPCNGQRWSTVASFIITSNTDFDAAHPAHTSLNDLFYIPKSLSGETSGTYDFYLLKEPEIEAIHQFNLMVISTDGDTLNNTANPIKILKQ